MPLKKEINNTKQLISNEIIIDNEFLEKPSLKIVWDKGSNDEAVTSLGKSVYNPINDTICNVFITFYENDNEYPHYNEDELKKSLWYEVQHIYRQYWVLKTEYEKSCINQKEKNYREIYTLREEDSTIHRSIKAALYYSDINEINSHLNEMIPYLEKHTEINFTNYKNYLNEIPGYNIILKLKELSSIYNNLIMYQKNNFTEKVGKVIYNKIYSKSYFYNDKNITPYECIKRLRLRLNSSVIYAQKQFYKILSHSLDKLQREGIYRWKNKNTKTFYNIFEEYRKLLKE